jgi:hypothetical protein
LSASAGKLESAAHVRKIAIMDVIPVESEESDTEYAMKNDDEFWSKINLGSLHAQVQVLGEALQHAAKDGS